MPSIDDIAAEYGERAAGSCGARGEPASPPTCQPRVRLSHAAGSANPSRIDDVRRYGEQDMPADARRPIEAAVASIRLNGRVRTGALPDIERWVASHAR